jgi:hypothetical protein
MTAAMTAIDIFVRKLSRGTRHLDGRIMLNLEELSVKVGQ